MIKYKDLNLNLPIHPNTGDLVFLEDTQAVKRSIINILNTMFGERPYDSEFGAGIYHILFEPVSALSAVTLQQTIVEGIKYYEPRVEIKNLIVIPSLEEDAYNVQLECFVYGMKEHTTIKFILDRVR